MLGKTHITLGIASALIITHPTTVPGVMTSMIGGAIGGWIVDVDCKDMDPDREKVYDTIIDGLFIGAMIVLDFLIGNGVCSYILNNWGVGVWGPFLGFIILMLIGYNTKHRTFTHSILGMLLFSAMVYMFCRPAAVAFAIGYASHLMADFFNKKGIQILFPLKWRPCLKLCASNDKANKVLFWVAFALDAVIGAFLFATAMINAGGASEFVFKLQNTKLFGLNSLQLYLIFINVITFFGFQRSWKMAYREELAEKDKSVRIALEFETWVLDFLVFIGGGLGMMISLLIHLRFPGGYNGNWWAFCYASILLWTTVYLYVCNPLGFTMRPIQWISAKHISVLVYLLCINVISALLFYSFRKKHLNEYSSIHTLLWFMGALGGTAGAYPVVIGVKRDHSFNYAVIGFPIMLVSQIVFVIYMLSVGFF